MANNLFANTANTGKVIVVCRVNWYQALDAVNQSKIFRPEDSASYSCVLHRKVAMIRVTEKGLVFKVLVQNLKV